MLHDDKSIPRVPNVQFKPKNGSSFTFNPLADTGTSKTIISYDLARLHNIQIDSSESWKIEGAGQGHLLDYSGCAIIKISFQGHSTNVKCLISKSISNDIYLSIWACQALKIISSDFPNATHSGYCNNININADMSSSISKSPTNESPTTSQQSSPTNESPTTSNQYPTHGSPTTSHQSSTNESPTTGNPYCHHHKTSTKFTKIYDINSAKTAIDKLASTTYKTVFDTSDGLRPMVGQPMKIYLKNFELKDLPKNIKIYVPRKIPQAYVIASEAEIQSCLDNKVIRRVDHPTDFCAACRFVPKPGGGIRMTTDFSALNTIVNRPTHPFKSPYEIVSSIPKGQTCFAVLDCHKAYWQIPLDEESQELTTFITHLGRFCYTRAPQGLCSSGDEYCRRGDEALAGIEGIEKLIDDILIYASNYNTLLQRIEQVFQRCLKYGITLSISKYQIGDSVKFAGFIINSTGYSIDPERTMALREFPTPKHITDIRSLNGALQQYTVFYPDLSHAMENLRPLLSNKNQFQWTLEHEQSLKYIKDFICNPNGPILRYYDPDLPLHLYTDASRQGLGFALVQPSPNEPDHLIKCGSRTVSDAETRYAICELECVAIYFAITKCSFYLAGKSFTVKTDHKSLESIFNGMNIDAIYNARIQRLVARLAGYVFNVEFISGKRNAFADFLSRRPLFPPEETADILDGCEVAHAKTIISNYMSTSPTPDYEIVSDLNTAHIRAIESHVESSSLDLDLRSLSEVASKDKTYQEIISLLNQGKTPNQMPDNHPSKLFKEQWPHLHVDSDCKLLMYHSRIVIPEEARPDILKNLHLQHMGKTYTRETAKSLYFWPGMNNNIDQMIEKCLECMKLLPSQQKEPLIQTIASRPFEKVSTDLFEIAKKFYLILADRYSGWPEVGKLKRTGTSDVTDLLQQWFIQHGKPCQIRHDGGPNVDSKEFEDWCKSQGIEHIPSSAYYPQSNGHAEATVKGMKYLLLKHHENWDDFQNALREWRNTKRADGLSPAEWLYGRRQRTHAVAHPDSYKRIDDTTWSQHESRRKELAENSKHHSDQHAYKLSPLPLNSKAMLQNPKTKRWDSLVTISEVRPSGSYWVTFENGARTLRNRRYLRPINTSPAITDYQSPTTSSQSPATSDTLNSNTPSSQSPTTSDTLNSNTPTPTTNLPRRSKRLKK